MKKSREVEKLRSREVSLNYSTSKLLKRSDLPHSYGFEKLNVWKKAKEFAVKAYLITSKFPPEEKFGIVSQIRRAAVSVASNIAEGSSRTSTKDQAHFSQIAYGSLMEVLCQFDIANGLGFLSGEDLLELRQKIEEISRMLNSLHHSQHNDFC